MAKKVDYRRADPHLYAPSSDPHLIDVPSMRFFQVDGEGDPNGPAFAAAVEALYSLSYAVRMSHKGDDVPEGYYEYTVYPLEGVWDLIDRTKPATDKANLKYTLMIRQPDFLTDQLVERFREQTLRKKHNPLLDQVRFAPVTDGPSCQALHFGPFDDEPATIARMERFCAERGVERASKLHREIYLTDPRKTAPGKARTVLRFAVDRVV